MPHIEKMLITDINRIRTKIAVTPNGLCRQQGETTHARKCIDVCADTVHLQHDR